MTGAQIMKDELHYKEPMYGRRHILICFQATNTLFPFEPGGNDRDILLRIISNAKEANEDALLHAGQICDATLCNESNRN